MPPMYIRRMDVEYKSIANAEKIQVHDDAGSRSASAPKPIVIEQEHQEDDEKEVERRLNNDKCIAIASGGLQVSK